MRLYTNTKFKGHWAVPVAAVIIAKDTAHAMQLLMEELHRRLLDDQDTDIIVDGMVQIGDCVIAGSPRVIMLSDGNY